jgi:hypothetical protein
VVPEEVQDGECERSTTVMVINKKAVNNDSIDMVAKSIDCALDPPLITVEDADK